MPWRVPSQVVRGEAIPDPAHSSPSAIVRVHSQRIVRTLVERREEFRADPARLHGYIDQELQQIFDREYSARLVLAQHGRGASQAEIDTFASALIDHLLQRYADALLEVDPRFEVKVRNETPLRDGALMRVATEIEREGGPPVRVDYLFRDTREGWRVFDVIVEGISYVQTYRTQFAEQLRGKSLAQVTAELQRGEINVAIE